MAAKVAIHAEREARDGGQADMFRSRLDQILDMKHELVKLAAVVDWPALESDLSGYYCADTGRPAGSIRLIAGLIFLKDAMGLSDEEVRAVWRENPYFQYFCGEGFFQHRLPVEPPSLSIPANGSVRRDRSGFWLRRSGWD